MRLFAALVLATSATAAQQHLIEGAAVQLEHRDFPLAQHAWTRKAAVSARSFEEAQSGLGVAYRKYALANLRAINLDNFNQRPSEFSKDHAVGPAPAVAAFGNEKLAALIEKDYPEGLARRIDRTPGIRVNGRPFIETFAFEEVAKATDAELATSK